MKRRTGAVRFVSGERRSGQPRRLLRFWWKQAPCSPRPHSLRHTNGADRPGKTKPTAHFSTGEDRNTGNARPNYISDCRSCASYSVRPCERPLLLPPAVTVPWK